jgi:hypothetical protein
MQKQQRLNEINLSLRILFSQKVPNFVKINKLQQEYINLSKV